MTLENFTDQQLTAFLDGEADKNLSNAIELALKSNASLQQRLNDLDINREQISTSFDALLEQAPELPESLTTKTNTVVNIRLAVCASLLLAIGFLGGWQSQSLWDNNDRWHQYVAAYQSLYIPSTLTHIDNTVDQQHKELTRISLITGKKIALESLTSSEELVYKRAQILGFEGKPLAQLTFLTESDTPIALCIIKASSLKNTAIETKTIEGMSAANWQQDGYAYLLIGGNDDPFIHNAAEYFANIL